MGFCNIEASSQARRINYKEDFEVLLQLMQGEYPMDFPEHDFTVTFKSFQGSYEVGRKDGVYNRCAVKDGKLHCYLNSHGLSVGTLRVEIDIKYPDDNFEDGNKRKIFIAGGQVELVSGNTIYRSADIEIPMDVITVDAYQLAVRKGYTGTIEEFYSTFTLLSETMRELREAGEQVADVVSSENSRVDAERIRVQSENLRVLNERERNTAEILRIEAETERGTAEQQRVTETQNAIDRVNKAIANVKDGADGRLRRVYHGTEDTTFSLTPNTVHVWGVVESLNLDLDKSTEEEGVFAEYGFAFKCPSNARTNFLIPTGVRWYNDIIIKPEAGMAYQAIIVDDVIIMGGVSYESV